MRLPEVALCLLFLVSPSLFQYNTMSMGPYDPIFQGIEECPNIGEGKMRFSFRPHRGSRSQVNLDVNFSTSVRIDDTVSILSKGAQFTNGGWKENFFVKEFPKVCTTTITYIPDVMKKLAASAGYPRGDKCPISPKNYTIRNFKMELDFGRLLPVFTYSKYRTDIHVKRGSHIYGCFRLYMDLVPKRKQRRKKGR